MMNMQRYPRDPAPITLSHEHSDVDTMESDSCQSSADAGDSQETGSVGDETVAKGGDDDDDAEILVATKVSLHLELRTVCRVTE
jgi:hypothetical protein